MKTYQIHDNGGRPFYVEISGMNVSVWKNNSQEVEMNGKWKYVQLPPKHLFDVTANKIFVGKPSSFAGYGGLSAKKAEGNSILLAVGDKYVFIGSEIYEFSPRPGDTIEKYFSDIGGSDVPHPYAVGNTHIYIMSYKCTVDKSFFDMKKDILDQYYSHEFQQMRKKLRTKQLHKRVW
jgi:hypothetical protein